MKTRVFLPFFVGAFFFFASPLFGQDFHFSEEDQRFLEMIQRQTFDFFLYEHHPRTGLVKDKADNFASDQTTIASIASTGFGLTSMVAGAERGWIPKEEAQKYCLKTLRFFWNEMENHHGFFYHFANWATGKRIRTTELSSIDTALFLAGALTAGEYFKGTEVETLANQIYGRVDFPWMLNGGKTFSMGWDPQLQRFLKHRWQDYNESFILYLLATGSPTHPIPADSWHHVHKRIGIYDPHVLIYSPPLFTHQYSHIWVDFRDKNDGFADYFENSRIATLVNRQFCMDHQRQFKTYSENVWGLTASVSPAGYRAYGSGPGAAVHDGTVAPTAAGSSIVFTPELSFRALKFMYENFKDRIWGRYGFSDAFNLDRKWYAREVLGIGQGPILLMIENARTELIWKIFMHHPSVIQGMQRIGFKPGTLKLKAPTPPTVEIGPIRGEIVVDAQLGEWGSSQPLKLEHPQHREIGEISGAEDLEGTLFLAWDPNFLYVAASVSDESVVAKGKGNQIWRDDLLELFLDPKRDGFRWENHEDFQIGLSPAQAGSGGRTWVWPQGLKASGSEAILSEIRTRDSGYDLEAKISWQFLGIEPRAGLSFGFSPALHDLDADGSEGKLVWFFLPEGKSNNNALGEAVLKNQPSGSIIPE